MANNGGSGFSGSFGGGGASGGGPGAGGGTAGGGIKSTIGAGAARVANQVKTKLEIKDTGNAYQNGGITNWQDVLGATAQFAYDPSAG
jgi:hypothetical protein